ncbi:MAG: hypothetical protein HY906_20660 [Deltaproteobacteria bacterium]|nr:hypothetical protein [Deltaproteobacteria bacterium]
MLLLAAALATAPACSRSAYCKTETRAMVISAAEATASSDAPWHGMPGHCVKAVQADAGNVEVVWCDVEWRVWDLFDYHPELSGGSWLIAGGFGRVGTDCDIIPGVTDESWGCYGVGVSLAFPGSDRVVPAEEMAADWDEHSSGDDSPREDRVQESRGSGWAHDHYDWHYDGVDPHYDGPDPVMEFDLTFYDAAGNWRRLQGTAFKRHYEVKVFCD